LGIDAFGNLTQTTQIAGKPLVMSVNQQVNTKNQFTLLGYGYDAAGNVLTDGLSSGCSGYGYSWNAEEMASCANGVTYTYNGDLERVKKSNGTLYWGGEQGNALAESDLSGNLTSEYVYFGGKRIVKRDMVRTIDVRFTNDSCSGCGGGTPVGGGDRNLFITSFTIGSTTIPVTDPSVSFNQNGCTSLTGGGSALAVGCNGDVYVTTTSNSPNIVVNAYGSPDYSIYPHMQVYLNGGLAGEWDVPASTQAYTANPVYYYLSDHLGSSNVVANSLGEVLDESDFYPFGGELQITNSLPNHYKFTGKERDTETGNDYFGARYYASSMGRFMSPDWSAKVEPVPYSKLDDPQHLNLYAYVQDHPLTMTDPDGHCNDKSGDATQTAECLAEGVQQSGSQIVDELKERVQRFISGQASQDAVNEKIVSPAKEKLPETKVSASATFAGQTQSTDGTRSLSPHVAGLSVDVKVKVHKGEANEIGDVSVGASRHMSVSATLGEAPNGHTVVTQVGVSLGGSIPELPEVHGIKGDGSVTKSFAQKASDWVQQKAGELTDMLVTHF
jgi:RHS repeat-associated protein